MPNLAEFQAFLSGENAWVVQVFIIVFVTLLANYIAVRLLDRMQQQLLRTDNLWDDALLAAARRPAAFAIWVIGIAWAAEVVQLESDAAIFAAIDPLRDVLIIALLTWFLVRFVREAENNLLQRVGHEDEEEAALDESTIHAIGKLLRMAVIITAALVVLQTLGYSISGVLAFGGIGGIAVGFAAKDLLANFFGGLMVYLDRPFVIGDWIRSPDKSIEGTVEYIGWRQTRIRTFDKRPLYVPNSTFTQIAVENPSRMSHRRIYETFGIRYDDAAVLKAVVDDVEAMLRAHEAIDHSQTLMVNVNAFAESSLDFFVYCFTHTVNWQEYHKVKQDVLIRILDIVASHDAQIAFPTRVVELHAAGTAAES